MNTSNITNYKPKDFAELIGVSGKHYSVGTGKELLEANRRTQRIGVIILTTNIFNLKA